MKRNFKSIFSMLLIFAVVFSCSITAFAASAGPDLNRKGSITLTLRDLEGDKKPVPGGCFRIYRVAQIKIDNSNFLYTLSEEFKGSQVDLNNLNDPLLADHLLDYASQKKLNPISEKTAGSDGSVSFRDLKPGLYLMQQVGEVQGYYQISPFLVSLPFYDSNNKLWLYDVDASPKTQLKPESEFKKLSVEKLWKDDGRHPHEIQVNLLKNGEVFETLSLSEDTGWKHSWDKLDNSARWTVVENNVPKGYTVSYEFADTKITITNTKDTPSGKPPLIQTGQLNWPVPLMIILGEVLIIVGFFLRKQNAD